MSIILKDPKLIKTQGYINGQWTKSKESFPVFNPYNQKLITEIANLKPEDAEKAIESADRAFLVWSNYTASKRSRILKKWYNLILENVDDLGIILSTEQGKPLAEAKGEIKYGASYIEWFAEEAKRVYGDIIPGHGRDKRITIIKQPIGVVGAITPWNFPSAMITRKVAPALAAGCTVVLKPSELTPMSALALAELADRAGFPAGAINILPTLDASGIGKVLTSSKTVRKISFTGSTEVGKVLLKQSADTVKKVSLELGGNAPFIVFDDADVDEAVQGAIDSKFRNAGQTCICSNRIFVQAGIYDVFAVKLGEKAYALQTGEGISEETEIGPLVEDEALQFVEAVVQDAIDKGAEVVVGGKRHDEINLLYMPTVLKDANPNMRIFNEEIFGPIAPLYKFETEDEVIQLANDTEYGLASYFYGRDYARIWRVAEALQYGMVGINTGLISTPVAPFGGIKQSGFGREGSKYGIDDYLNIKYMCWGMVK